MRLFGRIEIVRGNVQRERNEVTRLSEIHRATENAYNKYLKEIGDSEIMSNLWMQLLVKSFAAAPYIVAGIEHIHGDTKKGADKKTLAMEALGLSEASAGALLPDEYQPALAAATAAVSAAIDNIKAVMNAAKQIPAPVEAQQIGAANSATTL